MIKFNRVTESEMDILIELGTRTFTDTFAESNTPENMRKYIEETYSPARQLQEIKDPLRIIEIAWIDEQPAGFFHLYNGRPDPCINSESPLELLRLYVDKQWHGRSVGSALMERIVAIGKSRGFKSLWLGVWEHNHRALSFYKKFGFSVVGKHDFVLGTDIQTDLIMTRQV